MNLKSIVPVLTALCLLSFTQPGRALDITATGSGNWSSTNADAPWPGGVVPGSNDDVDVESPNIITVDTNTTIQYIYGGGTVVMSAGTTLTVLGDASGAYGTEQLQLLDATAVGNTVIYQGNAFQAKRTDYYNVVFTNATTNLYDFYNGIVPDSGAINMNIAGDMTVFGKIKVQQGADVSVGGNLIIGTNSTWDCSSFRLTVVSNTVIGGLLIDLDGALGSNYFGGNVTVNASPGGGWNISDVTQWAVGGSLTNNGTIAGGKGYGCITFNGTGIITGKAFKIPTITVNGTYTIGTTITLITNTPTLNGTLVFDLIRTNQLVLQTYPANPLTNYYSGSLVVINSGPAPVAGGTYKLFNAVAYAGAFSSISYPGLSSGLGWLNNLVTSGSISVASTIVGAPHLTVFNSGGILTLSWDSATYPGFRVQAQTNNSGLGTSWGPTGSGTNSPYATTIDPANPAVFYRLSNP